MVEQQILESYSADRMALVDLTFRGMFRFDDSFISKLSQVITCQICTKNAEKAINAHFSSFGSSPAMGCYISK